MHPECQTVTEIVHMSSKNLYWLQPTSLRFCKKRSALRTLDPESIPNSEERNRFLIYGEQHILHDRAPTVVDHAETTYKQRYKHIFNLPYTLIIAHPTLTCSQQAQHQTCEGAKDGFNGISSNKESTCTSIGPVTTSGILPTFESIIPAYGAVTATRAVPKMFIPWAPGKCKLKDQTKSSCGVPSGNTGNQPPLAIGKTGIGSILGGVQSSDNVFEKNFSFDSKLSLPTSIFTQSDTPTGSELRLLPSPCFPLHDKYVSSYLGNDANRICSTVPRGTRLATGWTLSVTLVENNACNRHSYSGSACDGSSSVILPKLSCGIRVINFPSFESYLFADKLYTPFGHDLQRLGCMECMLQWKSVGFAQLPWWFEIAIAFSGDVDGHMGRVGRTSCVFSGVAILRG